LPGKCLLLLNSPYSRAYSELPKSFIHRNFPKETPLLAGMLIALNLARTFGVPAFSTYLLVCITLASTLVVEEGLVHKWLGSRLTVWVGGISYSIYVWQQLFFFRPKESIQPLGNLSAFPFNLVCVLVVSSFSFHCIEKPCIALGKRVIARRRMNPDAQTVEDAVGKKTMRWKNPFSRKASMQRCGPPS
jgi:peptidoglycan/LPS O-acetylase OafA/YrhL